MTTTTKVKSFAVIGALATLTVFAETNIGKHSPGEIRSACNAAGGTLLGISDSGAYGCEVERTGALILCHKDQSCTAFAQTKTRPSRIDLAGILNQGAKTAKR